MGDGRLTLDHETRDTKAVDPTDTQKIRIVPTGRRLPVRIVRVMRETFCSFCSRSPIKSGVELSRGPKARKPGQPHHVVCLLCARRIGAAAQGD